MQGQLSASTLPALLDDRGYQHQPGGSSTDIEVPVDALTSALVTLHQCKDVVLALCQVQDCVLKLLVVTISNVHM